MRRFGAVLVLCAAVLSLGLTATLASADSYLKTVKLNFIEAGQLPSTAKDTMFVQGKADTARSTVIDLSDADLSAVLPGQAGSTVIPFASIDFIVTKANNGAADTLTFNIERMSGVPAGVSTACPTCRPDSVFQYNPIVASSTNSAIGSVAVAYGGASPLNNVFHGLLCTDEDAQSAILQSYLKRFRIVVAGDVSGTTPKLSGVMGFVTYWAKR